MPAPTRAPYLFLSILLLLVPAACGDDAVSPADLAGTWRGQSDQGRSLSFTVSGGQVTTVEVGFLVQGSRCTVEGSMGGPFNSAIDDGRFTVRITGIDPSVTLEGTFGSSSRASGTMQFSSGQCGGSATTNWTATKQ